MLTGVSIRGAGFRGRRRGSRRYLDAVGMLDGMRPNRAFAVGLVGNTALAALKLGVGWFAGSRALVADGWHSLSDIATNLGTWLAHRFSQRPPDDDHHYGHGRAEALAGALVGFVLIFAGLGVVFSVWTSKASLAAGFRGQVALAVAGVSIVANLALAWVSLRAGRRARSHGLLALARDNGSDAMASVLVLAGILGARHGWAWAEPLAANVIGGLIVWMGYRSVSEGIDVLMDRVNDPALLIRLREVAAGVDGVRGVQSVRVHPLGAKVRVDMEISVNGDSTVEEGHRIAHAVDRAVKGTHEHVDGVHVHVNPWKPPTTEVAASDSPRGPGPTPATTG